MDNDKMIAKKQTDVNAQCKIGVQVRTYGYKILDKIGIGFSNLHKRFIATLLFFSADTLDIEPLLLTTPKLDIEPKKLQTPGQRGLQ